jgi:hypothetical protein
MKIYQIHINATNKLPNEFPEFHNICYKQIKNYIPIMFISLHFELNCL